MENEIQKLGPEWETLNDFAMQRGVEVLYAPPRYQAMDPKKEGSWADVVYDGKRVGLIWTDWEASTGVIPEYENEFFKHLDSYLEAAKSANVPAGSAFTSMGTHILEVGPEGVSIEKTNSGPLSKALESILDDNESRDGDE